MNNLIQYIYGIADNALILGQRLGELCGHGPNLETDIAMTNIALDLLGQTRSYYQYAAQLSGNDATEDTIAFLRNEREYKNVLLAEQPNTDFAYSIGRQFLYDQFHLLLLEELQNSTDETLAAIAKKKHQRSALPPSFFYRLGEAFGRRNRRKPRQNAKCHQRFMDIHRRIIPPN